MKAMRLAVAAVILAAATDSGRAADPPRPVVLEGHTRAVSAVAWAADGKAVATAGDDRTIRVWDPATGRQTASLTGIARGGYGGGCRVHRGPRGRGGQLLGRDHDPHRGRRQGAGQDRPDPRPRAEIHIPA